MREAKAAQQKDAEKQAAGPSVVVERDALSAALTLVDRVVERRNTVPILANVLIEVNGAGRLTLTAANLDQMTRVSVAAAGDAFATTVPSGSLAALIANYPTGAQVSLTLGVGAGGGHLHVRCGRSHVRLPVLPRDDFPLWPEGAPGAVMETTGAALCGALARVAHAQLNSEVRYYLNGVLFAQRDGQTVLVATDGYRLVEVTGAVPPMDGAADIIVPRAFVNLLVREAKDAAAISLTLEQVKDIARLTVRWGDVAMTSKLVDATFPDWSRVIPPANDKHSTVDSAALLTALRRVALIASDKTRGVRLDLPDAAVADGEVVALISTTNPGTSSRAEEEMPVDWSGDALTVGANGTYLTQMIEAMTGGEGELQAALADSRAPMLFTAPNAPGVRGVLMPMNA